MTDKKTKDLSEDGYSNEIEKPQASTDDQYNLSFRSVTDEICNDKNLATNKNDKIKDGAQKTDVELQGKSALLPSRIKSENLVHQTGYSDTGFAIIPVNDSLKLSACENYLVDNFLFESDISMIVGQSTVGKSFLSIDLAAHIAMGKSWLGMSVKQSGVLYLALEGERGAKKRFLAQIKKHPEALGKGKPLAYSSPYLDLCSTESCDEVLKLVSEFEQKFSIKCGLVIIDTLAQAMMGEENSSNDMSHFVRSLKFISKNMNANVLVVHHYGKNVENGPRGHSSLFAACDTVIEVKKSDKLSKLKVIKQKDGEAGFQASFELEPVELEIDGTDASPKITSCVPRFLTGSDKED